MRRVVFHGPSVSAETVARLCPGAESRPPAGRGDLLGAGLVAGDAALVVDGYFFHRPALQHHEVLSVLRRGVRVLGCSSLGALRAAELCDVGMVGVGDIFERFRSGVLDADDEVAVVHDPDTYECRSDALVNLRHNLARAVSAGALDGELAAEVLARLSRRWFGERRYALALRFLRELDPSAAERLAAFWAHGREDVKERDARRGLEALARLPADAPLPSALPAPTAFGAALARRAETLHGTSVMDALHYCQVREPDGARVVRRAALVALASLLGAPPDESLDDDAVTRLCRERLVRAGRLVPAAPTDAVEAFLAPLQLEPGLPAVDGLVAALAARGSLSRAAAELATFRDERLVPRVGRELAEWGRCPRELVVALYARTWGIDRGDVALEARRRGFEDLDHLVAAAGTLLVATKVKADLG